MTISLKRKEILRKEKRHSSVFRKAFQISRKYFSCHIHFKKDLFYKRNWLNVQCFCTIKWLEVYLLRPGWGASTPQATPHHSARLPQQFASTGTGLGRESWVERGTVKLVSCPRTQHSDHGKGSIQTALPCHAQCNHRYAMAPPYQSYYFVLLSQYCLENAKMGRKKFVFNDGY